MRPLEIGILFAAGLAGGFQNAIAGGATFFTFPAMMAAGLSPIVANASSTVALWPASAVAAWTERRTILAQRRSVLPFLGIGIAGGLIGALLLLVTPERGFRVLVPFLLLLATLLFAFSRQLVALARRLSGRDATPERLGIGVLAAIGLCSIYGGYFGAGVGIMMMAGLAVGGIADLHLANSFKNFLVGAINGIAVVVFVASGIVAWTATLAMLAGAVLGGYLGGRTARHIPAKLLRTVVIVVGTLLTIWYFVTL